jgi:magnesium transporter
MMLDLKFSIGTLGIGTGTLFSALYGMNLKNFLEESDVGFTAISLTCFILSAIVCTYGLKKLRKLQRVSMWGERGSHQTRGGRGNWRDVDPASLGNGWESRYDRIRRLNETQSVSAAVRRGWLAGERERHGSSLRAPTNGGEGWVGAGYAEHSPPIPKDTTIEKAK